MSTQEIVQSIQSTTVALQKAKDVYTAKSLEYEKLKNDNASAKDLEKAEVKLRKSYEEYKTLVEKYNTIRAEFEIKMGNSCQVNMVEFWF